VFWCPYELLVGDGLNCPIHNYYDLYEERHLKIFFEHFQVLKEVHLLISLNLQLVVAGCRKRTVNEELAQGFFY
jgi:hypothetical protein